MSRRNFWNKGEANGRGKKEGSDDEDSDDADASSATKHESDDASTSSEKASDDGSVDVCVKCGYTLCSVIKFKEEIFSTSEGVTLMHEEYTNAQRRHKAYTLYTQMIYGSLGKHNRTPLPVCVERGFKAMWREANSYDYTGYKSS